MNARLAAVVRLLETRNDHLPEPGQGRPLSSAGFVHGEKHRVTCPDCAANVGLGRRRGIGACETCRGRGYLEVTLQVDPYDTGEGRGWFGSSTAWHERLREERRLVARLDAQTAPPRPEAEIVATARPEAWERSRERRWADFDYRALDLELDRLRLVDDLAYRVAHAVHVYGTKRADLLSPAEERARLWGLRFLSVRLPERLRAPCWRGRPAGDCRGCWVLEACIARAEAAA